MNKDIKEQVHTPQKGERAESGVCPRGQAHGYLACPDCGSVFYGRPESCPFCGRCFKPGGG